MISVFTEIVPAHSFGLSYSSSESSVKAVTVKKVVQLVQACATATEKYGKNLKNPKKSSLSNSGSFRKQDYLIKLCHFGSFT